MNAFKAGQTYRIRRVGEAVLAYSMWIAGFTMIACYLLAGYQP